MADERGSVASVTDSAGATIKINAFDEYGIPAPGNVGRFGYTGQTWLPEVGLWYYKARIYSPTLGRFLQTDPSGYTDGMNWYNYVGGDPVNGKDPSGLNTSSIVVNGGRNDVGSILPIVFRINEAYQLFQQTQTIVVTAIKSKPHNGRRGLTSREKRILMCNGATQDSVDTFSLSSGLPAGFGLNPRVDAVTLSPISGISVAHMKDGISEMTSSRDQYGLIAHEFAHHIQYRQGMTLYSYLSDTFKSGYYDSMYETIARDFSKMVVENWDNGKCR